MCENTDPDVRKDLEQFITQWCPDGQAQFRHQMEGPDDMPAHIRTIFTHSDLTVPIQRGTLFLGSWQGVYLYEHRISPHRRTICITIIGDSHN